MHTLMDTMLKLNHAAIVAVLLVCTGFCPAADSIPRVRFLPELHLSADISRYLLPKNEYFREVYFLESEIFLEPLWLSFRDRFFLLTSFEVSPGMGQKGLRNVLFDPLAINYAITTVFEYRLPFGTVQVGEDHRCFHEVDRKMFPTVYWNLLYLAAASPGYRIGPATCAALVDSEWTLLSRLSWYARWGVFIKGFFGLVKDSNVDFENNRIHEAWVWARFAALRWRGVVLSTSGSTRFGIWEAQQADGGGREWYWQQIFGMEVSVFRGAAGFGGFVNYIFDDIPLYRAKPRFSRDRLLKIGLRFFL